MEYLTHGKIIMIKGHRFGQHPYKHIIITDITNQSLQPISLSVSDSLFDLIYVLNIFKTYCTSIFGVCA
jgi:hypothetical protein